MLQSGLVKRHDLWITSKVWNDVHHDVIGSCEKSLTDLQLEWEKPIHQYVPTITAKKDFMNTLPENWDDVKFIDGFPGRFFILASKKSGRWYIASIKGENSVRKITLNVPFISDISKGFNITDSINTKDFIKREINFSVPVNITMRPYGGFVIKTLSK